MNPFIYPKSKHVRKENPPAYVNYRSYKPFLKSEFEGKCIYCLIHDSIKSEAEFGVEHYRPKKKFPKLSTEYMNLYYACNACNRRKGNFWPSASQKTKGIFIPNPCEEIMFSHLQYKGERVVSKSSAGEWTIELLQLNNDEDVDYRRFVLDTINLYKEKLSEGKKTLSLMRKKLAATSSIPSKVQITQDITDHTLKIQSLERNLQKLLGK